MVKLQRGTAMVNSQNRVLNVWDRTRTKTRTKGTSNPISPPTGHRKHSTRIPDSCYISVLTSSWVVTVKYCIYRPFNLFMVWRPGFSARRILFFASALPSHLVSRPLVNNKTIHVLSDC
jgi:hypothetical protein